MPIDFNFRSAFIDHSYRSLASAVKNGAISGPARAYVANVDRCLSLLKMPGAMSAISEYSTSVHLSSYLKRHGKIENTEEVFSSEQTTPHSRSVGLNFKINLGLLHTIIETDTPEYWDMSASIVDSVSDAVRLKTVDDGLGAVLSGAVIGAWTAFEVLATDVWVEAVNHGPLAFVKKAVERVSKRSPIGSEDRVESGGQTRSVPLDTLASYAFDLKNKVGTFLREQKKVDFQSLNNIKAAYERAFGDDFKSLVEPEFGHVLALEAVRNLLVHRAGVVDHRFTSNNHVKIHLPELLSGVGETILLNGDIVRRLVEPSVRLGSKLLMLADGALGEGQT